MPHLRGRKKAPEYPYKFMANSKPSGRCGQRCRKVPPQPGEHIPKDRASSWLSLRAADDFS